MKLVTAICENSFNLTKIGLILELKHEENGLESGLKLTSLKSGLSYLIKTRVLFDHAIEY